MFARSFSVAGLLALVAALFATQANAMAQGSLSESFSTPLLPRSLANLLRLFDYTRDYIIEYKTSTFANTEAFCQKLRSKCVDYVGPVGENGSHHQLDCVFDTPVVQAGPRIHAFCGGLEKNADGTWTKDGSGVITDYTSAVIGQYFSGTAAIKQQPMGKAACEKFAATHNNVVC
ncbi:hypothetical protein JCM10207_001474 [Rhodosporidiobolus poonsookiae]